MTRTTAGLLMTDIEGSTRLLQELGPAYGEVLVEHRRLIRAAIHAHNGQEQSTEGDSFFVTFPSASDAVAAAMMAQQALFDHRWPTEDGVRVRMGIHVGAIEEIADTIVGMAVHEAARIATAAHGGQVLASDEVTRLVAAPAPGASWHDLGPHSLKDIVEPVRLWQLRHPDLPSDFPPLRSIRSAPRRLPAQPSSFIGRRQEIDELGQLLQLERLVTVTGAGGAGKSRLALRVAAEVSGRYPDGVWFIDLVSTSEPAAVTARIAAEIGLAEGEDDLWSFLQPRQALLLIDNCEHLLDAVADVARDLVVQCPTVTVLATSREPLGAPGETVWRVPAMTPDDALELLVTRSRAVSSRTGPASEQQDALSTICRRLDALPLALELAAARTASLSPEQIAERLDERFRLLTGGSRGTLSRHRTLQATVDWSYEMLDESERAVFRRTGVFAGGFSLEAFESMCAGEESLPAIDLVDRLVSKSLVVAEDVGPVVRYRLLETMRQYAIDRLRERGELAGARAVHARWVQQLVAEAASVWFFSGGDETAWLNRMDLEAANVAAAFEWSLDSGDVERAAAIPFGVMGWLVARGRSKEGHAWTRRVLAAAPDGEALALAAAAALMYSSNLGPLPVEEVAAAAETMHWLTRTERAWFVPMLEAFVAAWSYPLGDRAAARRAIPACERAVAESAAVGIAAEAMALQPLLWTHFDAGDVDSARALAERGLEKAREAGLAMVEGRMAVNLSRIALAQGDLEAAWESAERAVSLARGTGEPFVAVVATEQLVDVAERRGEYGRAGALLAGILDAAAEFRRPEEVAALATRMDRLVSLSAVR